MHALLVLCRVLPAWHMLAKIFTTVDNCVTTAFSKGGARINKNWKVLVVTLEGKIVVSPFKEMWNTSLRRCDHWCKSKTQWNSHRRICICSVAHLHFAKVREAVKRDIWWKFSWLLSFTFAKHFTNRFCKCYDSEQSTIYWCICAAHQITHTIHVTNSPT